MLKPNFPKKSAPQFRGRFGIVASRYNDKYVASLLERTQKVLQDGGAALVKVYRVPGAFEIPVVASQLAWSETLNLDAVIAIGVILRGETTHADHIGLGVTHALANIQVETGVPVVHGVYLFENTSQADARCLDPDHNRGEELGRTALEMAAVVNSIEP